MKKFAYKNSRPERLKFVDSLPTDTKKEYSTDNAGRAGWNLMEMSQDINGVTAETKLDLTEDCDIDMAPTVNLLTELGDSLDAEGNIVEADFVDFLLVKIAAENKKSYLKRFNELMIKISTADIPDSNETIKKLTKIFSNTIMLETGTGTSKEDAYKSAYQKTLHRAEQYLVSGKMIKHAQSYQSPIIIAQNIKKIIDTMVGNFALDARMRAYPNLRNKIKSLNPEQIASKRSAGGAALGVSISLVKNILNGRDPIFVRMVINNLVRILT